MTAQIFAPALVRASASPTVVVTAESSTTSGVVRLDTLVSAADASRGYKASSTPGSQARCLHTTAAELRGPARTTTQGNTELDDVEGVVEVEVI
jgi:hypothetical protein